jgi:hypothetical protein
MSKGGAMEINLKCIMYLNSIKSDGILDLYLDFYFTYKCEYKESRSSLLRMPGTSTTVGNIGQFMHNGLPPTVINKLDSDSLNSSIATV